jgi:hypothetical protein
LLPVSRLPGNNLAYRREILLQEMGVFGLIEGQVNEQLISCGFPLYLLPAMKVKYSMMDSNAIRLKTRFQHGRLFAGNRVAGQARKIRIGWFLKALLLPVVLTARGWSSMTRAVEPRAWLRVLVWISILETAWAAGEAFGYLKGTGHSLEAWR